MEKSEKKLSLDQKKTDLLELVSEIGEKISSDEKHPGKVIDIGYGTTALSEMFSKHIEYYFSVGDVLKYFLAINSTINDQQQTIEKLKKEMQDLKEVNEIVEEEKEINHQPTIG